MPRKMLRPPLAADPIAVIILVTGAAGLLGGALVAELLALGHGVIGLVHRAVEICGNDGVPVTTRSFDGLAPLPGTAVTLGGDVCKPGLGLDTAMQGRLAAHVDLVIHCAALVRFEAAAEDLAAVNVEGTRHVAQAFPAARIIHVSTAYVCGLRDGHIAEAPCDPDSAFGNGYEASKARAEAVIHQLRPDAIIVRPSIIVGEAATGRIRSFDTIYRAFKLIAEGRVASIPVMPQASLDFVPIDHVVNGICDLVARPDATSAIIHLAAHEAVNAAHFLSVIGQIPGFSSAIIVSGDCGGERPGGIAERLAQPYWGYFRRYPDFETQRLMTLTGRKAPVIDDDALIRQIGYCINAGFIRRKMYQSRPAFAHS